MKIRLLAGIALLALCATAVAQGRRDRGQATSASFEYYLLALSWSPEFCAQPGAASSNPEECARSASSKLRPGFVIHGLWPESNDGRGPENCGPARPVPRITVNMMLPLMPGKGLIQHEWATHGTCSGLSVSDYFTAVMQARTSVQIPVQISGSDAVANEPPGMIESQFAAANPGFSRDGFKVACRNGALTEVRVCFTKDLKSRACAASAGACNSRSVSVRPAL